MKKWLIVVVLIVLIAVIAPFAFIPATLKIGTYAPASASLNGAYRSIANEGNWIKWWPKEQLADIWFKKFSYNGDTYHISQLLNNGVEITIQHGSDSIKSQLLVLRWSADSVALQWQCTLPAGNNPFKRIIAYNNATAIKENLTFILGRLRSFIDIQKNIYGIDIQRGTVTDTLLIALKSTKQVYPGTAEIYQAAATLKNYIARNGAVQTAPPIMNVTETDSNQFRLMLAVPVNKTLPVKDSIFPTRMIPGSFMITTVTGGAYRVRHASEQLQQYFSDYGKTSMGIPFESLVTDRLLQPDSTKWVTKIYAPVY